MAVVTSELVRQRMIGDLHPHPLNPRGEVYPITVEELAASVRAQGILQPLLILPNGTVLAGHRRLAAARMAGLREVPVIVIERKLTTAEQVEIMLTENVQRDNLSPLQEARGYRQLLNEGLTQADVARRVGVPSARVQSRLPILQLCPDVMAMYDRGQLPVTLAAALARVVDTHHQQRLANMAARRQYPAPKIEELIKRSLGEWEAQAASRPVVEEVPAGPSGLSPTRIELLDRLQAEPDTTISFRDLAAAVEATCCWCGMETSPEICANCPMPQLVARVVSLA